MKAEGSQGASGGIEGVRRLAVLSDVHGNLMALEAVLADLQQYYVDGIIVAGDLLTGGPQPVETLHVLRSLGCWMIRGNTDDYLLEFDSGNATDGWRASKQWALARWSYQQVDRETLDYIAALPEQRVIHLPGTAPIRVVHGSPDNPSAFLFPNRDPAKMDLFRRGAFLKPGQEPPGLSLAIAQVDEPLLICGHTHISWRQSEDGKLALNPGAVCGSLEGDSRARYALLTWQDAVWQVEQRAVLYDVERVGSAFHDSGLLADGGPLARAFLLSIETGVNVGQFFVLHAYGLAAEAGFAGCDLVPDQIWEQAGTTFDWSLKEFGGIQRN